LNGVIEIDFKEIGINGVDWTNLAHDKKKWYAGVKMVITLQYYKYGEFFG
jgi:hypothetical protein